MRPPDETRDTSGHCRRIPGCAKFTQEQPTRRRERLLVEEASMRAAFGSVAVVHDAAGSGRRFAGQEQIKPQPAPSRMRRRLLARRDRMLSRTLVAADTGRPVRRRSDAGKPGRWSAQGRPRRTRRSSFSFTAADRVVHAVGHPTRGYPGRGVRPAHARLGSARAPRFSSPPVRSSRTSRCECRAPAFSQASPTDEFGDPMMGMQVRAWLTVKRSGERTLQLASTATTDDRDPAAYRDSCLVNISIGTGARDTSGRR